MLINPCIVMFKILKQKNGKSTGNDKTPVNVLKELEAEVLRPLCVI